MTRPERNRPHILEILPDGSPGGGSTAVLGLCKDLLGTGACDVTLVTQPGSALAETAMREGISTETLDFFTSRLDLRIPGRLAALVETLRPDVIHAHGARGGLPFCSRRLRDAGPLVYTVHGYHHTKKPFPLRQFARFAEQRIAARADSVIFVSEGDRALAGRDGILPPQSQTGQVIFNGIDPADFDDLPPMDEQFDLIFAGRAHPQKNPLFMVDIMESLAGSGIRLRMIAGGELEPALRERIATSPARDAIVLTGALPRREVLRAFRSSRLFVLPSLWEGLPIAPIEALYSGLPVIASKVGGTDEVVMDGVNGRLIERFAGGDYAEAIRNILNDNALHDRLAAQGRALVEQRFVRKVSSTRHLELYQRLLAANRPSPAITSHR